MCVCKCVCVCVASVCVGGGEKETERERERSVIVSLLILICFIWFYVHVDWWLYMWTTKAPFLYTPISSIFSLWYGLSEPEDEFPCFHWSTGNEVLLYCICIVLCVDSSTNHYWQHSYRNWMINHGSIFEQILDFEIWFWTLPLDKPCFKKALTMVKVFFILKFLLICYLAPWSHTGLLTPNHQYSP